MYRQGDLLYRVIDFVDFSYEEKVLQSVSVATGSKNLTHMAIGTNIIVRGDFNNDDICSEVSSFKEITNDVTRIRSAGPYYIATLYSEHEIKLCHPKHKEHRGVSKDFRIDGDVVYAPANKLILVMRQRDGSDLRRMAD